MAKNTNISHNAYLLKKQEDKIKALRQALIEGEESLHNDLLDMESIRLEAKRSKINSQTRFKVNQAL